MSKKVAIFWPGDYRASRTNGPSPSRARRPTNSSPRYEARDIAVPDRGLPDAPDEAIARLGPIDDPMIGVFVHWTYARTRSTGSWARTTRSCWRRTFRGHGRAWSPSSIPAPRSKASAATPRGPGPMPPTGPPTPASWSGSTNGAPPGSIHTPPSEIHGAGAVTAEAVRSRRGPGRDPPPPRAGIDARRHVDGDDQRLFRSQAALPDRIQRAQGRPGLADRPDAHR